MIAQNTHPHIIILFHISLDLVDPLPIPLIINFCGFKNVIYTNLSFMGLGFFGQLKDAVSWT